MFYLLPSVLLFFLRWRLSELLVLSFLNVHGLICSQLSNYSFGFLNMNTRSRFSDLVPVLTCFMWESEEICCGFLVENRKSWSSALAGKQPLSWSCHVPVLLSVTLVCCQKYTVLLPCLGNTSVHRAVFYTKEEKTSHSHPNGTCCKKYFC